MSYQTDVEPYQGIMNRLRRRVRKRRNQWGAKGMTQEEASEKLGWSTSKTSRELRHDNIRLRELIQLAQVYGLEVQLVDPTPACAACGADLDGVYQKTLDGRLCLNGCS